MTNVFWTATAWRRRWPPSPETFGYDGVLAEMGLGPEPSVLGCPVEVEGNDVPLVVETIIDGREDLGRRSRRFRDRGAGGKLEPVERLVSCVGGEYAVLGSVRSPFEYAATVRGLMEFMTDFYRDPDLVRDLIAACCRPRWQSAGRWRRPASTPW